jgi:2-polyprenyl-6-methoxyphenol hydroxylase-like FAD-dependent oxidoreductase
MSDQSTTCVIVGGGPAGMVAGLLLARGGVQVTVLEKHPDFLRDFRGDTVHPSTLQLLDELGLYDQFTALPTVTKFEKLGFNANGRQVVMTDFTRLRRLPHRYLAMVPQWDLLDLLADAARDEPTFSLRMRHEVTGLLRDSTGRVTGVRYTSPDGPGQLHAHLTLVCDGRWSVCRRAAGLSEREFSVTTDMWWFRLPTDHDFQAPALPNRINGQALIGGIPRKGYLQMGYAIPKGADARMRARGIEALRHDVATAIPALAGEVKNLTSMDDVKLLDIRINRLTRWYTDGLLCIGDAAHAMSPAGGVGINLAVQDAVAAATRLATPLRERRVTTKDLAAVQRRRAWPARVVQRGQVLGHRRGLDRLVAGKPVGSGKRIRVLASLVGRIPALSALPAYVVGVGVRPEHAPEFARRDRQLSNT